MRARSVLFFIILGLLIAGFAAYLYRFRIDYTLRFSSSCEHLSPDTLVLWSRTTRLLDTARVTVDDDKFPPARLRWSRGRLHASTDSNGLVFSLALQGWPPLTGRLRLAGHTARWRWTSGPGSWEAQWRLWRRAPELKRLLDSFSHQVLLPCNRPFLAWKALTHPTLTVFRPTQVLGVRTLVPPERWLQWVRRSLQITVHEAGAAGMALDQQPFLYWFDPASDTADVLIGYGVRYPDQAPPSLQWSILYSIKGGPAWRLERPLSFQDVPAFVEEALRWAPQLNPSPSGAPWALFLPDPVRSRQRPYAGLLVVYFPVDTHLVHPEALLKKYGEASDPKP